METEIPFLSLLFLAPALRESMHSEIHSEFRITAQTKAGGWGGWKYKEYRSIQGHGLYQHGFVQQTY